MEKYEPELGQALFGGPWESHKMTDAVERFLADLGEAIDAAACAPKNQEGWNNPASNVGAEFACDAFEMRSYCWCDGSAEGHEEVCPPNFKCGDFEARWYKWVGRGGSQSRAIGRDELERMRARCMAAVRPTPDAPRGGHGG